MIQVQLKLKLRPAQERLFERWLWRLTGAWNWAVRKVEGDAANGIYHSAFDIKALVRGHGRKIAVPGDALDGIVADAHKAWHRCFTGVSRRPRLKGRRNSLNTIPFPHGKELRPRDWRLNIPGLGRVRYHKQEIPAGRLSYARIVRRSSGWHACLFIQAEPMPIPHLLDAQVGIDPGFSSLLTLSTGEVVEHPHELRAGAERLAQAQRGQRRMLTARLHERMANRRRDRNHKLSRRLVSENSVIAWSKDRTSAVQRSFGRSVTSSSHSQLRSMLAYKCRAGDRRFIEVDSRNSTRACSSCRALTGPAGWAGLSVRRWVCACGAQHDRDVNAAINTLQAGLRTSLECGREAASGIAI